MSSRLYWCATILGCRLIYCSMFSTFVRCVRHFQFWVFVESSPISTGNFFSLFLGQNRQLPWQESKRVKRSPRDRKRGRERETKRARERRNGKMRRTLWNGNKPLRLSAMCGYYRRVLILSQPGQSYSKSKKKNKNKPTQNREKEKKAHTHELDPSLEFIFMMKMCLWAGSICFVVCWWRWILFKFISLSCARCKIKATKF